MKKALSLIAILSAFMAIAVLSSCRRRCIRGSGNRYTDTHTVEGFNKINISGDFKVNIKQDSSSTVSIRTDGSYMEYISASVDSYNRLTIKAKKDFCEDANVIITIGVRKIDEIVATGAVEINTKGKLNADNLSIELRGAAKLNLDINATNLVTHGNGLTELVLTGQAATHQIEMSGVSKVDAFGFKANNCYVQTSGESQCNIDALKMLYIKSSGVADINYKGSPTSVYRGKSGSIIIAKVN